MIFYLDAKNVTNNQIQDIQEELNQEMEQQKQKLDILLECLSKINYSIQNTTDMENPKETTDLLAETKKNLDTTRANISKIKELISSVSIEDELAKYYELANLYKNDLYDSSNSYNSYISKYAQKTSYDLCATVKTNEKQANETTNKDKIQTIENKKITPKSQKAPEIKDNNTLLISEKYSKIFLPYSVSDLKKVLSKNKEYDTLQEVIENEYTVPIEQYKNSVIARFKEGYNLMRKKEKASVKKSLDLALEVAFKRSLNPAVITACKNFSELNTYLDCLETNSLDKFKIFKIRYEISPTSNI